MKFRLFSADTEAYEAHESIPTVSMTTDENRPTNSDWPLLDNVRHSDIKLLRALRVGTIVDFMVEKKKVKFGLK